MALSGLDIYKLLPKTNCKDCGYATCLAFAMALAQKKVSLDKCPHVSSQAKDALESAGQPPIKLVTIGVGDSRVEIGNETVMYRHEQKFYHPTAIGFIIEDTVDEDGVDNAVAIINKLRTERVGQVVNVNLICIKNSSGYQNKFVNTVRHVMAMSDLAIALYACDIASVGEALKICKDKRPLLICEDVSKLDGFVKLAKDNDVPIAITCANPEEAADLTEKVKKAGVTEIVINFAEKNIQKRIQSITYVRRTALKNNFRPLGYPVMAMTVSEKPDQELAEVVSYISKYAGIVILKNTNREFVFPALVARQDIYQDPQKPVQVEPKIYEIGKVSKESPLLVTTNFSITYFTVAGEVEASKVPSYIMCCDSEGMSVLTAWAAEKFTPEKVVDAMKKSGVENLVSHKKIIIPGYVSVMSGRLEEMSGWKVSVGPREASGITNYLRSWK